AAMLRHLAGLHAMSGRLDRARQLLTQSNAVIAELGLTLNSAASHDEVIVELLAGNPALAEKRLWAGYRALDEMGEKAFLSTTAAFLARAIFEQGRTDEALRLTELSEELAERGDLATHVMWRGVRARILAAGGRVDEA